MTSFDRWLADGHCPHHATHDEAWELHADHENEARQDAIDDMYDPEDAHG